MQAPVIRAIDIGYGNTKFIINEIAGTAYQCDLFPSMAPPVVSEQPNHLSLEKRNTVRVRVGNRIYEVGKDIHLADPTGTSSVRHRDYVETPEYMALFLGALSYMQTPYIDLLVVGLPVDYMNSKKERLATLLEGTHAVANGKTVTIKSVLVFPQPLGGLMDYTRHSMDFSHRIRDSISLVVDPGYHTFDWVVAEGGKPIEKYCGSHPCGMDTVLQALAKSVSNAGGFHYDNYRQIDKGLRTGVFKCQGRAVDLAPHLANISPVMRQAINAMRTAIDPMMGDLDAVYLVGGGASVFQGLVSQAFEGRPVTPVDDSVFSNVRGFQFIGSRLATRLAQSVA